MTAFSALGEDVAKSTAYTAEVTGVVCAACKAHVTDAFKKLPGVDKVEFAKGEKEGTQKVSFASTASGLTKADAVKALGEAAKEYSIVSLDKAP
jgi:copper chaperone CopZ